MSDSKLGAFLSPKKLVFAIRDTVSGEYSDDIAACYNLFLYESGKKEKLPPDYKPPEAYKYPFSQAERPLSWYKGPEGRAAYDACQSTVDRFWYFYDFLCAQNDTWIDFEKKKSAFVRLAFIFTYMDVEGSPYYGYDNILDLSKNPLIKLSFALREIPWQEVETKDGEMDVNLLSVMQGLNGSSAWSDPEGLARLCGFWHLTKFSKDMSPEDMVKHCTEHLAVWLFTQPVDIDTYMMYDLDLHLGCKKQEELDRFAEAEINKFKKKRKLPNGMLKPLWTPHPALPEQKSKIGTPPPLSVPKEQLLFFLSFPFIFLLLGVVAIIGIAVAPESIFFGVLVGVFACSIIVMLLTYRNLKEYFTWQNKLLSYKNQIAEAEEHARPLVEAHRKWKEDITACVEGFSWKSFFDLALEYDDRYFDLMDKIVAKQEELDGEK